MIPITTAGIAIACSLQICDGACKRIAVERAVVIGRRRFFV